MQSLPQATLFIKNFLSIYSKEDFHFKASLKKRRVDIDKQWDFDFLKICENALFLEKCNEGLQKSKRPENETIIKRQILNWLKIMNKALQKCS